jgi:NAD(P)H-dependent FMN reductase
MEPKILAFSGSSRKESFNKKLLAIAALGAEEGGANVTLIDLADYPMPLFNQDLEDEKGIPKNALEFKRLLTNHDAFIIASPEYNSSFSPLLKNVIDWASRAESDTEPPMEAYQDKMAAILAASPGALGGLRGLVCLRMLLSNLGVVVLPDQQTIPRADKAFNGDGSLIDAKKQNAVKDLGRKLTLMAGKMKD